MAHKIAAHISPSHVHVVVTGDNTERDVLAYMEEVRQLCVQHSCWYVLIEESLSGPGLGITSVFDLASHGAETAREHFRAIAYVDVNPAHEHDMMKFAETVALNRGLQVRVFEDVDDAKRWLASLPREQ
jgi:SpoIIAA-like